MTLYLIATEKLKKPNEVKTSILPNCIGKEGQQIYNNFEFSSVNDEMNYDIVMTISEECSIPKKKLTLMRYKFLTSRQDEAEKFNDFINKLKTLSYECELKELRDSLTKYMIIIGANDPSLQENDLKLEFAIKPSQITEATRRQVELPQREPK